MAANLRLPGFALLCLALAVAALAVAAWQMPEAWLPAYLTAWLAAAAAAMGGAVLLLIHELTGGTWGERLAPMLRGLAAAMPPLALLFLPLLAAVGFLYPGAGGRPEAPQVMALYQNVPGFLARALLVLLVWSVVAWSALTLPHRPARRRKPYAAVLLIVYGVSVNFAAFDWLMGLDRHWHSTVIGWTLATLQIAAALSACALARPPQLDERTRGDLAKLLLATLLGLGYLWFMQFLVIWAGNLPHKVAWFVPRIEAPWRWVVVAAVLAGLVAPLALLLRRRARSSATWVAAAGGLALLALLLLLAWQVLPAFHARPLDLLVALLMTTALALLLRLVAPVLAGGRAARAEARP